MRELDAQGRRCGRTIAPGCSHRPTWRRPGWASAGARVVTVGDGAQRYHEALDAVPGGRVVIAGPGVPTARDPAPIGLGRL